MKHGFLPVSREDMKKQNIDQLDFVYVIGDAYVDHPSFGPAIISRLLEARGYTVGIIAQPDYRDKESVTILGEEGGEHYGTWRATAWIFSQCREHGFHGQSLYGGEKAPEDRCLHTRR